MLRSWRYKACHLDLLRSAVTLNSKQICAQCDSKQCEYRDIHIVEKCGKNMSHPEAAPGEFPELREPPDVSCEPTHDDTIFSGISTTGYNAAIVITSARSPPLLMSAGEWENIQ